MADLAGYGRQYGMASSKVRRAAGYGRQCGMVSNRVWQALRYGRYEVMASNAIMAGTHLWQAEGYGRLSGMASSKVWQVMWYGRHCCLAGSNVPYRDGRHHGMVGTAVDWQAAGDGPANDLWHAANYGRHGLWQTMRYCQQQGTGRQLGVAGNLH